MPSARILSFLCAFCRAFLVAGPKAMSILILAP